MYIIAINRFNYKANEFFILKKRRPGNNEMADRKINTTVRQSIFIIKDWFIDWKKKCSYTSNTSNRFNQSHHLATLLNSFYLQYKFQNNKPKLRVYITQLFPRRFRIPLFRNWSTLSIFDKFRKRSCGNFLSPARCVSKTRARTRK